MLSSSSVVRGECSRRCKTVGEDRDIYFVVARVEVRGKKFDSDGNTFVETHQVHRLCNLDKQVGAGRVVL